MDTQSIPGYRILKGIHGTGREHNCVWEHGNALEVETAEQAAVALLPASLGLDRLPDLRRACHYIHVRRCLLLPWYQARD